MNSDENLKNKPSLFIKGGVGGPGRPKNAINKNRLVSEVLNKLNFDPLTEAVSLFRDEETPVKVKADLVVKMMRLVYPEVKQIQVESHTMATNVNPIAEAMMQIKEKAEGFSYQNRNLSGTKDSKESSTTN
tara:strand:- start:2145 stop:2537 length:393 start_codon:yes stop_codon:yes gene_type:complete